ncbi:MAG: arylesterase [Pseudomonadota bacterium]|nr:arylesterase [Pseudomonadota bacterium]
MSSFVRTTLLLLLMALGLPAYSTDSTETKILLFGDSIIAGYGLAENDSIAVQLEKYMKDHQKNVKIVNAGVSGDTTSAGRSRLAWTLKRNKPDLVFLALGGNDVLRGFQPSMTKDNLDAMLSTLQESNTPVILSKVQPPTSLGEDYMMQLKESYESLAQNYKVPLYPFLLEPIFTTPEYMQKDGIHPSAAGVLHIVPALGDFMIENLEKLDH